MVLRSQFSCFALAAALLTAPLSAGESVTGQPVESISHGGRERRYGVHVPKPPPTRPAPLLVLLHGGGTMFPRALAKLTRGGFDRLADKEGFFVVYPYATISAWNDGRDVQSIQAQRENVDDVGFIAAVVDRFVRERGADPARVTIAGFSTGGTMAQRMICDRPDLFAALATVAGPIAANTADGCPRSLPLPALIIHGTKDPFMRWDADSVWAGGEKLGAILPVEKTVKFWLGRNGCPEKPRRRWLPDAAEDGTRTRLHSWGPCARGGSVLFYEVRGGGHAWPGGTQWSPAFIIGKAGKDFDASRSIWDFFKSCGK